MVERRPTPQQVAQQPASIVTPMMNHQLHGLRWMKWREQDEEFVRGGILADDMGLGKTLQIISLLVSGVPAAASGAGKEGASAECAHQPSSRSLVVVPASVLHQWRQEVKKHTVPGVASVHVYHGSNRQQILEEFSRPQDCHCIVLSTYETIGRDYDGAVKTGFFKKPDEPSGSKETKTGAGASAMMVGSMAAVADSVGSTPEKGSMAAEDAVLARAAAYGVAWDRIVCDEAHAMRNAKSRTAKALAALPATFRWCATGTPIQNKLEEYFSLLGFLRCETFSSKAVRDAYFSEARRENVALLTTAFLLRRMKSDKSADGALVVALPPRTMNLVEVEFTESERRGYDALIQESRTVLRSLQGEKQLQNSHILVSLLRLRLYCNHPALAPLPQSAMEAVAREASKGDDLDIEAAMAALNIDGGETKSRRKGKEEEEEEEEEEVTGEPGAGEVLGFKEESSKLRQCIAKLSDILAASSPQDKRPNKIVVVSQWVKMLNLVRV